MFILVFRPHQRAAWAVSYDTEHDFIAQFLNDACATSCHADADLETRESLDGKEHDERYQIVFARVGHDLNSLTRLDDADEVERYLTERDYSGAHNKGYSAVERVARDIGWIVDDADDSAS